MAQGIEVLGTEPVETRARAQVARLQRQSPEPPVPPADDAVQQAYASGVTLGRRQMEEHHGRMLGIFEALARILAARFLLLLGLLGAFALAVLTWRSASPISLYTMIAYDVLVVAPLVALEWRAREPGS